MKNYPEENTMERTRRPNVEETIKLIEAVKTEKELDDLIEGDTRETIKPAVEKKRKELTSTDKEEVKPTRKAVPVSVDPVVVFVANHHTGGITFPRGRTEKGIFTKPLRLAPGMVTPVPKEEWDKYKKMQQVKYYLDKHIISEVRRDGETQIHSSSTVDLSIPENLMTDEEIKGNSGAVASVKKQNPGSIDVE
jgi:hypothetical protein